MRRLKNVSVEVHCGRDSGRFNEYLKVWQDIHAIARKRGWAESTVRVPTVGTGNETIIEIEYPDLASFQKHSQAFQADAEVMKVYRVSAGIVVQGS